MESSDWKCGHRKIRGPSGRSVSGTSPVFARPGLIEGASDGRGMGLHPSYPSLRRLKRIVDG